MEIVQFDVPVPVVNDRCWPSGGGLVVVGVLVVVVVVVVVGTVSECDRDAPKESIWASIGASCVGVPRALREPLKDDAALVPHAGSAWPSDFAAFEKHFDMACAFLPIAVSCLPKQMSGP